MGNILRISLEEDRYCNDLNQKPKVLIRSNLAVDDIVNRMIEEGMQFDQHVIIDIINRYNSKVAELVLSGNRVNTGLVTLEPKVMGPIYRGHVHSLVNRPAVSFQYGQELLVALANTEIEIVPNNEDDPEEFQRDKNEESSEVTSASDKKKSFLDSENPPCGIAFRRWLYYA